MELAHRNHLISSHFIGFIFQYCLIEERPLNFAVCSSILCPSTFENTTWYDSFKWSMIGPLLWPLSVLSAKRRFCKTSWHLVLNANATYDMIAIPVHWYDLELVYSYDVTDTNKSWNFRGTGEKVPFILS